MKAEKSSFLTEFSGNTLEIPSWFASHTGVKRVYLTVYTIFL